MTNKRGIFDLKKDPTGSAAEFVQKGLEEYGLEAKAVIKGTLVAEEDICHSPEYREKTHYEYPYQLVAGAPVAADYHERKNDAYQYHDARYEGMIACEFEREERQQYYLYQYQKYREYYSVEHHAENFFEHLKRSFCYY